MRADLTLVPEERFLLGKAYVRPYLEFLQQWTDGQPVTAPVRARTFRLTPDTTCTTCDGPLAHQQYCAAGAPNLVVPALQLKVWWHTAPLRGAWMNRPLTVAQWERALQWVLAQEATAAATAAATAPAPALLTVGAP